MTTLKNFFRWLADAGIILHDPAARLIYRRAVPPLPDILSDGECRRLLTEATRDSRSYLLILLLLETGIKRQELMTIELGHIDLSNPYRAELWIRHRAHRFKDRKLRLPPEFADVLDGYVTDYQPQERLSECTRRNLAYILRDVADRAGIRKRVSPQVLRDTFAVRQLQRGERIERVLERLGLAPGSHNEETREKYLRLARPAL